MPCAHSPEGGPCPTCAATLPEANAPADPTLIRERGGARAPAPTKAEQLPTGARVGRYVVLERLGQGGMGVLYTAHDPQLQRLVAIKLLRSAATAGRSSSTGQARLLREAQAMAQLSHPNVVPVYDAGAFGDGIFVAMELVRGVTLDAWVKLEKRDWREVLGAFLSAGRGLLAAHAAGLMHRDFKPANVLMGEDGRPRVTDFGLARSTRGGTLAPDEEPTLSTGPRLTPPALSLSGASSSSLDTPLTQAGALMGSPGYMAPEQYAGQETSSATDQFSYCVSLFEALYGVRPFEGKTLQELADAASRGVVPPPPKGSPVPPWIHRVLVRGLAPEPAQRHPSMAALLDALAKDPAAARRRWLFVGGAAAALLAIVGGTLWLSRERARVCRGAEARLAGVWDDEVRGRGRAAFEATRVPFARPAWDRARASLDAWARDWVAARTEACEATRVRGEQTERQLTLRLDCLDRRLDELGALAQAFAAADREVAEGSANAVSRLSPLRACANVKGLEDRRQPPPELKAVADEQAQVLAQARALIAAGRIAEARKRVEPVATKVTALRLPALEAEANEALGELETQVQRFPEARSAFERAVRAAEVAGDDAAAARALAAMVSLVGWRLEKPDQARTLAALAAGILERIGGDALTEARLEEGLGDAEWQAGNRAESLDAYRKALASLVRLQGEESVDVARLRSSAGWVLTELGRLSEARVELERSRAIREKLLGDGHPALTATWNELSYLATEQGDMLEAVRCSERSLRVSEAAMGGDVLYTVRAQVNLAVALANDGRAAEAEPYLARSAAVIAAHPDAPPAFQQEHRRAQVLVAGGLGRDAEAVKQGRAWLTECEVRLGKEHPEVALFALSLARPLARTGQHAEALGLFDRYLSMREKLGAKTPAVGEALIESAGPLFGLGRGPEALARLERGAGVLVAGQAHRSRLAVGRLALAEGLVRGKRDLSRARALAAQAREDAAAAGRAADVDRAEAFLARHPAAR